jgi:chemotaxis protein MotB
LGSDLSDANAQAANLSVDIAALKELKAQLEAEVARLASDLLQRGDLVKQTELGNAATAQVELLNRQMAAIREQLARLEAALGRQGGSGGRMPLAILASA